MCGLISLNCNQLRLGLIIIIFIWKNVRKKGGIIGYTVRASIEILNVII